MRIVHDVDSELQCCAAVRGSLVSLSLVNDEEEIHIDGDPKYILPALKEAVIQLESVLSILHRAQTTEPAPAQQPATEDADVVQRMIRAYSGDYPFTEEARIDAERWRKASTLPGSILPLNSTLYAGMTAALVEARKGLHSDAEIAEALRKHWRSPADYEDEDAFVGNIIARLNGKEQQHGS